LVYCSCDDIFCNVLQLVGIVFMPPVEPSDILNTLLSSALPWVWIVLWELELMLCDDIGKFVENDKSR
jgi:hypothetical protein